MNTGYPWMLARARPGGVWHPVGTMHHERRSDDPIVVQWSSLCGRVERTGVDVAELVYTGDPDTRPVPPGHVCSWCRRRLGYHLEFLERVLADLDAIDDPRAPG